MTAPRAPSKVAGMAKDSKTAGAGRPRRYALAGASIDAPPLPAGLYLVATPIGNLRDISLRALETLAGRRRHRLRGQPRHPQAHRALWHRHAAHALSRAQRRRGAAEAARAAGRRASGRAGIRCRHAADLRSRLQAGARGAAMPVIAVIAVPGASAVLTALGVAGLPTDRFFFEGFLPPKQAARQKRIAALAAIPATLVLFESGPRLAAALADLAAGLGPRAAAICRELTKLHEEVRRGDLADARARTMRAAARRAARSSSWWRRPPTIRPNADDVDELLRSALVARLGQGRGRRSGARHRPAAPRGLSARARAAPRRTMAMARRGNGYAAAAPQAGAAAGKTGGISASAFRPRAAPPPG